MSDFLSGYSIQSWLERCPQGYLEGTVYGHEKAEREPDELMKNEALREQQIRTTVNLIVGERAALAASSGLGNATPDQRSKTFLATQTLDEARHVEIFSQRLLDLGVSQADFESTINTYANPHLVKFAGVLLEKVDKKDFVAGVVGQNIVLEGLAFSVFEMMHASAKIDNLKWAHTLAGTIADERRHVGFGENRIGALIRDNPGRKGEIEKMQKDMTGHMLATFAWTFGQDKDTVETVREMRKSSGKEEHAVYHGVDLNQASSAEIEKLLAETVIHEFKTRLARVGLDYQSPAA